MTKKLTTLILLGFLTLVACSSGGDQTSETLAGDEAAVSEGEGALAEPAEEAGRFAFQSGESQVLDQRKVIRTASLTIESDDPEAAYLAVTRIVEQAGGFVSEAGVSTPSQVGDQDYVSMTVRIPASSMTATLEAIEVVGEVLDRSLGSSDVTEEYADVEAQIRNLEVLETELLALLREVRSSSEAEPAELLTVFNRISEVRGQIEGLQGRQRLLDDLIGLATISITIQEPPSEPPIVDEDGWNLGATAQRALRATVTALQAVGSGLIWLLLTIVPLLLLAGVPAWVVWRFVNRRTARPVAGGGDAAEVAIEEPAMADAAPAPSDPMPPPTPGA